MSVEYPEIEYRQKTLACKCGGTMERIDDDDNFYLIFWCPNCGRLYTATPYTCGWREPVARS